MMIFLENVFLVMTFILVVVFSYNGCGCDTGSCLVPEGYRLCEDCHSCSGLIGNYTGGI